MPSEYQLAGERRYSEGDVCPALDECLVNKCDGIQRVVGITRGQSWEVCSDKMSLLKSGLGTN